jgi:hypothetical protein
MTTSQVVTVFCGLDAGRVCFICESQQRRLSAQPHGNSVTEFGTGLVFTPCVEPYLASEYGGDYDSDSPVKLLDKLLYGLKQTPKQQVVLLSQVRLTPGVRLLSL